MQRIIYFLIICLSLRLQGQNALKSFQWRDHLPYNQAYSVTHQGNKIYAVANECVFSFDKNDNSFERLNKVSGLSDVGPKLVRNNPYNNCLIIAYKNANIDVIKNGSISNVPDLLNKQGINNKTINEITFKGKYAYLACAFGIAVFNTESLEFEDTYIIGVGGTNINVYQVAFSLDSIYAATTNGLMCASLNASNLSSFTFWKKEGALPPQNLTYNGVVNFGGNIFASYSYALSNNQNPGNSNNDTLYKFNGTNWSKNNYNTVDAIKKLIVSDDGKQLIIMEGVGFMAYNLQGNVANMQWQFLNDSTILYATYYCEEAIPDPTEANYYWESNLVYGLFKFNTTQGSPKRFIINGPSNTNASQIQIKNNKIIVGSCYLGYQNKYNNWLSTGIYSFENSEWKTVKLSSAVDITCVAFDNNDNTHYYAGSFNGGLIEVKNDKVINTFDGSNSVIPYRDYPLDTWTEVTGLYTDINNNLWIGSDATHKCITVKKTDNTWTNLDFTNLLGPSNTSIDVNQLVVDSNNMVWLATYGYGIIVYQKDDNYTQPNAHNSKALVNIAGKGGLPTNNIISLAMDKTNNMWVGTDQGIYVFYNPSSIFTQDNGWDAQPIYVTQDGQTQLLLQTDAITSICVDGGNYKWVGTASSGLFYFSPDGQTQLYHFATDNSPLFSNNIINVNVNGQTGEVFVVTDKGIQSFQNVIEEGHTNFEDVYAYPNPVKPGYSGPVLIHGMVSGAEVKIVDEGGNFVYQTTSEGGQAVWNAQNEKGQRVKSGIYMAICAMPDGSQKKITKIMVMN